MSDLHDDGTMVLRTVYLPVRMDATLRELAHQHRFSKNDLIRASIANRLYAWRHEGEHERAAIEGDIQAAEDFSR